MAADLSRRPVRRCATCGSSLSEAGRRCPICGAPIPRRLTLQGVALEALLAVAAVSLLAAGLYWLRGHSNRFLSPDEQAAVELVARLPTDLPTSTATPWPSATTPPNTPYPPTATPLPATIVHVVQSGDTLFGIAAQYGVTGDTILEANTDVLDSPHRLSIGQELRIPVRPSEAAQADSDGGAETTEQEAAQVASADESQTPAEESGGPAAGQETSGRGDEEAVAVTQVVTYTIQLGDTLEGISEAQGIAVEELVELNPEMLADPASPLVPGESLTVRIVRADTNPVAREPDALDPKTAGGSGSAVLPPEELGVEQLPAPLALAPGPGVTVTATSPLLIWSSIGILPPGSYYVVAIRDAGDPEARPHLEWVINNATAIRVPADFRPALGSQRQLQWSVTVRQRVGRLLGPDEGVRLSSEPEWRTFTWAPGR